MQNVPAEKPRHFAIFLVAELRIALSPQGYEPCMQLLHLPAIYDYIAQFLAQCQVFCEWLMYLL